MKRKDNNTCGFTLVELLIVVAILTILAGILLTSNINNTLKKSRDAKRKQDLNKMTRILEDYYTDKLSYPLNDPGPGTIAGASWGSPFTPYVPLLPKDPLSPQRDYYYQTDPVSSKNFYALYAKLENTSDPDITRAGCQNGCGPGLSYNYVVHTPNVVMIAGLPSYQASTEGGGGGGGGGGGVGGAPTPTPGGPTPTPVAPPGSGCTFGQCGFCSKCGGYSGSDCGLLSRCWLYGTEWTCKFDIGCLF